MAYAPGMPMPGMPGVPGGPMPFSAEADADVLYHAMAGLGTNDTQLIEIIGARPRQHLVAVAAAYKARHGHSLEHDIKGDTSFHYKALLVALIKPIGEYLADLVHDAVEGAGTKEGELIDVFATAYPWEMQALRDAWAANYKKKHESLEKCIAEETSFNFKEALLHAVRGQRMPPGFVDPPRVEADAEALYRAGEKRLGTDDSTFIDIVMRSSAEHMMAVSRVYMDKHKHPVEKAIEKETSGDYGKLLLAYCTPRPVYVAKRVHDAVHGAGTNDSQLIRMFAMNDKPVLMQAAADYERMFKKSMAHDVENDTSGDYKRLLLRLLRP